MSKLGTLSSEAGDDVIPEKIVRDLMFQDLTTRTQAVLVARGLLCEEDPPVARIVEAGIIAPLVDVLDGGCSDLQYGALVLLTRIAFGARQHTVDVINNRVIPKLISFLANDDDPAKMAILSLGNFSLLGPAARHAVLSRGAVRAMLPHMRTDTPVRRLRTFVRAYSNLCSHDNNDDNINLELISPALPYIYDILDIENEESLDPDDKEVPFIACDIIVAACTALSNIMLGPDECIEAVQLVPGLTARLVGLLGHEGAAVREAALSAVGNMLAGTDVQVDHCLEVQCLDHIMSILQSSNASLVKEAVRAMSNILAGTHAQIQQALKKDILTLLQNFLDNRDPEYEKQVMYAVTCLCCNGSDTQRAQFVLSGALQPYCALLAAEERAVAGEVLDGINALMQGAERDGNVKHLCYVLDELDVLDNMQLMRERVTDGDRCSKLENMSATLRKHAREERSVVFHKKVFTSEMIVRELESQHQATHTRALRALHLMLCEQNPPINALLENGIIAPLVTGLDRSYCYELLYLAAWAISKITSISTRIFKHQFMDLKESGAISKLIVLLRHGDKISELAACSLGNITVHGPDVRDAVLAHVRAKMALPELRNYVRVYKKLCEGPLENFDCTKRALPFVSLLLDIGDQKITEEVCKAYVNLVPSQIELGIEAVQSVPGLIARLVALMDHEVTQVKISALYTVYWMLSGTNDQAARCLDAGCLDHLMPLLQCNEPELVYLATSATCKLFCHTQSHIQQALDKDILTPLLNVLAKGDSRHQDESGMVITNIFCNGSATQRARLIRSGVLQPYCALLAAEDLEVVRNILGVLCGLLHFLWQQKKPEELKLLCLKLETIGVIEQLQKLQEQEIDKDCRLMAVAASALLRRKARGEWVVEVEGELFTLTKIVRDLKSDVLATQTRAACAARELLSEPTPPYTAMLEAGVIPPLVAALDKHEYPDLQKHAVCAIFFISTGEHKHRVAVVNSGAIPKLITILTQECSLTEIAANLLTNMCNSAPITRDMILAHGAVRAVLPHMRRDAPLDIMRSCVLLYSRLCVGIVPTTMFELVVPALPYISELLNIADKDVLRYACSAIDLLTYGPKERIDAVQLVPGLTARLMQLMGHEGGAVRNEALNTVASMLCGTDVQANRCLDAGCFEYIIHLLQCSDASLLEKAVRATANVLRHSSLHAQLALEKGIHSQLLKILADAEPNSFLEYYVVGAIANFAAWTREHKLAVVNGGNIPNLVDLITSRRAIVVEEGLRLLQHLVAAGPETRDMILAHGALRAILPHMRPDAPLELLQNCVRTYSNFCAHISTPVFEFLVLALPHICELLCNKDEEILCSACNALIHILNGPNECIEAVQLVPTLTARLVGLLGHEETAVRKMALVAVGAMLVGTDVQFNRCLDAGCVVHIVSILQCSEPSLVKEALMRTRSVLLHSRFIQQKVLKDIIKPLLNILAKSQPNSSLQYYGVTALNNLAGSEIREHRMVLVTAGAIPKLVTLLAHGDGEVAKVAIDILRHLTRHETKIKNMALAHGAVRAMLPHMRRDAPLDLLKSCVMAYFIFCRHEDEDDISTKMLELVSPALPRISELLDRLPGDEDNTVLELVCCTLVELTKTSEGVEAVQLVPGLTARLVGLLGHEEPEVQRDALEAVMPMLCRTRTQIEHCLNAGYIEYIVPLLQSSDPIIVERAASTMINIFCNKDWIQLALEVGILAPLFNILSNTESIMLFYAVATLDSMTENGTLEHITIVINGGAIPKLVALLSREDDIATLAAKVLGNMARAGPQTRDIVLAHGAVRAMLPHMRADAPLNILTCCLWTYQQLCGHDVGKSKESLELVLPALPNMSELLDVGDENILKTVIWGAIGLSKTCEGLEAVQLVPGLTARLVGLLGGGEPAVKHVAITAVILMLSGTDTQVGRCLAANCVEHLMSFLECRDPTLLQEATEATRATLGVEHPLIQRALDEDSLTPLMAVLTCHPKGQIRTVKAISNLCCRVAPAERARLVTRGALQPCGALLAAEDAAVAQAALDALDVLLEIEANDNHLESFCLKLAEISVLDQIKKLRKHEDKEVNQKAHRLLNTYFPEE